MQKKRKSPARAKTRQRRASVEEGESEKDAVPAEPSDEEVEEVCQSAQTPSQRRGKAQARAATIPKLAKAAPEKIDATSVSTRAKQAVYTPLRLKGLDGTDTPTRRTIADRSARRKSTRALIAKVVGNSASDEDEDGDAKITREIFESSGEDGKQVEDDESGSADDEETLEAATPSKTSRRRQKKAGQTVNGSPTLPRNLPRYEHYLYQNKPGGPKTSNNTLSSLTLLTHDEYFKILHQAKDRHAENIYFLHTLHMQSFPQWAFELSQGFSLCLYGYGSKRKLLRQFATHLYTTAQARKINPTTNPMVIINGYVRTLTARDILTTIALAIDPSYKLPPGNAAAATPSLLRHLSFLSTHTLTLIIHSIDAPPLRKPAFQTTLASLASHPSIRLACSADTPDFPLLWDSAQRSAFSFVFHDGTTFHPLESDDVVDQVHDLLGRRTRRAGGKDGVAFVLRSLPENARSLFRLLVGEVLVLTMDGDGSGGGEDENPGVEYRMVYGKAMEEFICSSEIAFRTLLKEFHDHEIITSRKDAIGTELLSLPFSRKELEAILEELAS